jgi:hypothetical protein
MARPAITARFHVDAFRRAAADVNTCVQDLEQVELMYICGQVDSECVEMARECLMIAEAEFARMRNGSAIAA